MGRNVLNCHFYLRELTLYQAQRGYRLSWDCGNTWIGLPEVKVGDKLKSAYRH